MSVPPQALKGSTLSKPCAVITIYNFTWDSKVFSDPVTDNNTRNISKITVAMRAYLDHPDEQILSFDRDDKLGVTITTVRYEIA